MEFFVDVIIG